MNTSAAQPSAFPFRLERRSFSPFVCYNAPSAFLAALLVKFSATAAVAWNVQVISWLFTFGYFYFMVCRAAYMWIYRSTHGSSGSRDETAAAELIFNGMLRCAMRDLALWAGAVLLLGSLVDVALRGADPNQRNAAEELIWLADGASWLLLTPSLLAACGLWATTNNFSLRQSFDLVRLHRRRIILPWTAVALAIFVGTLEAARFLYPPVMTFVAVMTANPRITYLASASLLAAIILGQIWTQTMFAAWLTALLGDQRREVDRQGLLPHVEPPGNAARANALSLRRVTHNPLDRTFGLRVVGSLLMVSSIIFTASLGFHIASTTASEGWVTGSQATCRAEWDSGLARSKQYEVLDCETAAAFVAAHPDLKHLSVLSGMAITVRYSLKNDTKATFTQFVTSKNAQPLHPGSTVVVRYQPNDPTSARIQFGMLAPLLILVLAGAIVGGLLVLRSIGTEHVALATAGMSGHRGHRRLQVYTYASVLGFVALGLIFRPSAQQLALVKVALVILVIAAVIARRVLRSRR